MAPPSEEAPSNITSNAAVDSNDNTNKKELDTMETVSVEGDNEEEVVVTEAEAETEVVTETEAAAAAPLTSATTAATTTKEEEEEEEEVKLEFLDDSPDPNQEEGALLKHNLRPGDHVIRWEMTVIAWPIQIHGIVLEVGKQYVELADFGLTAQPQRNSGNQNKDKDNTCSGESAATSTSTSTPTNTPTSTSTTGKLGDGSQFHVQQQAPFMDHPVAQKMEEAVASAWNKLRKDKQRPKQRITVHIITTQKELNRWHKVNYGGKLFGIGGPGESNDMIEEEGIVNPENMTHKKQTLADKFKMSLNFGGNKQNSSNSKGMTKEDQSSASQEQYPKFPRIRAATQKVNTSMQNIKNNPTIQNVNEKTKQGIQKTGNATVQGWTRITSLWSPKNKQQHQQQYQEHPQHTHHTNLEIHGNSASIEEQDTTEMSTEEQASMKGNHNDAATKNNSQEEEESEQNQQQQEQPDIAPLKTDFSKRLMNPAMAKIMADKEKEKEKQSSNRTATKEKEKPKNKLPKSDPPKLVLARAYFLLKHGEAVLPPYHAFHSNSECIAVFCKTGVWSTLQAAVFLHSTAIGNAKSTMAVTLGVAASVPVLAPVIGGIGLAMVGAPWLILKESKGKWEEATMKLTDLFWAQADPEVFVECIEHWSGLVDRTKLQLQQQEQSQSSPTNSKHSVDVSSNDGGEEETGVKSQQQDSPSKNEDGDKCKMEQLLENNDEDASVTKGQVETAKVPPRESEQSKNGEAKPTPANARLASV